MSNHPRVNTFDYMRLLVDRVPTMLAYWDSDLLCRFANRAYESWFGVNPDDLLGTHVRDLLGPELFAKNEPLMRKVLAGERQVFERVIPGPNGILRPCLAEYIPDMVDGVGIGFLVQVTNLTELKETQAALHRETQLRAEVQAYAEQLQALLRERTEMLDVLAHEVRQPLHNASAALQSAQAFLGLSGKGERHASEQLLRAQGVLGDVLGSLDNTLAVASLLARPDPIQRDDADLDVLIAIAVADMPAPERHRIEVLRETGTRTVSMDMSLMRLALRNVLSNALKFSRPGEAVRLRITDTPEPPAVVIDVSDAGGGVPQDMQPNLFTRGARGNHVRGAHGLGLGLYIVERVMDLHHGTACVAHTGPQGTTVRLVLPQADT